LRGQGGEKEIAASDLKYYQAYPPECTEALEKLMQMLKDGTITQEDLKDLQRRSMTKEVL
jgi:hypothetical protein